MGKRAHGEGSIYERSDGRWAGSITIGYTRDGRQKRRTVYGRTQGEARKKLEELKMQASMGVLPDAGMTTQAYLKRWLDEKKKSVKPRTIDAYTYIVENYISPKIGRKKLEKLKPLHIQAMVTDLAQEVSPDCANKARKVLFGALKQAVRWQMIPRNPVEAVDTLKVPKRDMILWSPAEAAKVLDHARPHRLHAVFYLAMSTGLRRGELLGLHWSDLEGARLRVRRSLGPANGHYRISTPKTRKGERSVALTADTLDVLEQHHSRQAAERRELGEMWRRPDVMFASKVGDYMDPDNLSRLWRHLQDDAREAWKKVAEEVNDTVTLKRLEAGKLLPSLRLHDLRHLHASIAIRAGMDPKVLADRLGHARASFTLDVYTHLFDEQRDSAAVSIRDLFQSGVESS